MISEFRKTRITKWILGGITGVRQGKRSDYEPF